MRFPDRRIGILDIPAKYMEDLFPIIRMIFDRIIVFRAEMHYIRDSIKYVCFCDAFREIKEGELLPLYTVEVTKCGNGEMSLHFREERNDNH